MLVTTTETDLLTHINANVPLPPVPVSPPSIPSVEDTSGSYKFFSFFEIDWSLSTSPISVTVNLYADVPIFGKVKLAGGTIDASHPTITIGGGAHGFKAEVKLSFDFSTYMLSVTATACAFGKCKQGNFSIHL